MAGISFILFYSGLYITMLPHEAKQLIVLIVALGTLALPLAMVSFFKMSHFISNFYISDRRERVLPLIISAILYYIAYRVLHMLHTPYIVQKFILASTVAIFLTSIISMRWKISIHGVGIGGIMGMFGALSMVSTSMLPFFLISILLAGVVGYARIRLNAHTPAQVYAGILLGFGVILGMFLLV